MSRLKVWELDNAETHEFNAIWPRGWTVDGIRSVSSSGPTSVAVPDDVALKPWLRFGRFVTAAHDRLPLSCAMIDPPWGASLPVTIALHPLAYVLSLRTPDAPVVIRGDVFYIVRELIGMINAQQELWLRPGRFSGADIVREETIDQRSYWEQLNALVARAGKELLLRPAEVGGRLIIYVDVETRVGVDTGFLLHDGQGANIEVLDPVIDGKIINRLTGIGSQNTVGSRLATTPQINTASRDAFRLRSEALQYQNVVTESTLINNTLNDLAFSSWPRLKIPIKLLDVGKTFAQIAPGNGYIVHVGEIYLPGGVKGYRGPARLTALMYDETDNTVGGLLETAYVPG